MRLCAQESQGQKSGDPQLSNGESRKIAEEGRLRGLPLGRPRAERRGQGKPRSRRGACANSCKKTRHLSPDSRGAQETREHRTEAAEVGGGGGTEEGHIHPDLEVWLEERGAFEHP